MRDGKTSEGKNGERDEWFILSAQWWLMCERVVLLASRAHAHLPCSFHGIAISTLQKVSMLERVVGEYLNGKRTNILNSELMQLWKMLTYFLLLCSMCGLTIAYGNKGVIYPPTAETTDIPLYVGLVQSYDPSLPDEVLDSVGTVVGTEIALDHINADATMLPGYSLHYNFINSPVCISIGIVYTYITYLHGFFTTNIVMIIT